jgi:V8-like Glu-specific endopeptidase
MFPSHLTTIHQLLLQHFDEQELIDICFGLGITYEDLPPGARSSKARELILYVQRRGRLDDLRTVVSQKRPHAVWPSEGTTSDSPAVPVTAWQLERDDFDHLVRLLVELPDFRTPDRRVDFLEDVFAGSPRKQDLLGLLDVSGTPRAAAVRLITRLTQFGQDEPGQESLGVLINKLLNYVGGGSEADFLRDLFERYPLQGVPVSTRGLDEWRGRESPQDVQEKIIGENTLRDVRLLELALVASRAVVRIRSDTGLGSGFLSGPRLVMTNNHVIGSRQMAQQSAFTFNYQLDQALRPAPVQTTRALPDGLFYTNADLDVTVVEIEEIPDGVTPLQLAGLAVQRDQRVNIIQHPGGHYKKISMQNNFVAYADARHLQYLTSTEPGSSGSPVFDDNFVVVGIHHSGGNLLEPGTDRRYLRNAGTSMIAILDDLRTNAPQIHAQLRRQQA